MDAIVPASLDGVFRTIAIAVAVVAFCGCGSSADKTTTNTASTTAATTSNGAPVIDGIKCEPEHLESHYHAHLTLLRDGKPVEVPALIGIDVQHQCLYWLHTHDATGIIHIESPDTRTYTLGEFFDVWGQPLSRTQADGLKGTLKVFVGNRAYTGDPRSIVLKPHELITIEVGQTVPPPPFRFPAGL
jgi:hypothetical protein